MGKNPEKRFGSGRLVQSQTAKEGRQENKEGEEEDELSSSHSGETLIFSAAKRLNRKF